MKRVYEFDEYVMSSDGPQATGASLGFMARSVKGAVSHCLYTAKLTNGRAKVGPSGRVVHAGDGRQYVLRPRKIAQR